MKKPDAGSRKAARSRPAVILVVEDEVLVRMAISMDLAEAGYNVIEAADAGEALAVLEGGHEIDLVFSDVHMPGPIDGIGLLGALRRRYPDLPVILTSAHGLPPSRTLAADTVFIAKPYLPTTVLNLVAQEIGRRVECDGEGAA